MGLSRRDLMKKAGLVAAAGGFAGLSLSLANNAIGSMQGQQNQIPNLPWPYKKLDPIAVAEDGYTGYYKGACSYGVFESIIGPLRKEIGFPYTMMPSELVVVGQGGTADTASLCGALSGAAAAIFLVTGGMDRKLREVAYAIIQDVFLQYEQTALPDYRPKNPKFEIVKSVSGSNLCHISVSKWCKESNFKSFSKERSDRCGWITASVAKHTAEALNKHADGKFKAAYPLSATAQSCRSCHDKGSKLENTRGITDCGGCHFTPKSKKDHPKI
ncbi:MAG: C-GCAxxG-C-C family (seleno)protein [Smithellaceae bacterium]|nr:C-GCAxxG-C-C family (seleno)protein [Smithellaceae bacterium]